MNDKINIDKQMREKLEGFSMAPPSHIWNNLQGQMAAQKKRKRLAYIGWISAAAVMVFAFIAGWYVNERSGTLIQQITEQKVEQAPAIENSTISMVPEENENLQAESDQDNTGNSYVKPVHVKTINTAGQELGIENTFVASIEKISYDLLESLEAVLLQEENKTMLAERKALSKDVQAQEQTELNSIDANIVASNAHNYKKEMLSERGWILGAHVSPGYSSQSTSHGESYARNMSYNVDNGGSNMGGGVSVQYKTSKRLRFESGVYYSQNGQSSANALGRHFGIGKNVEYLYSAPENVAADQPAFSNTVALSSDGLAMNSVAGVVNLRTTPKGATVARNAEFMDSNNTGVLSTSGEFSQVFEFVEVPLYLRYNLLDKRFGIEVLGGINAGFVVGNNAYIDNEYGKQNVGSTEDISTLNFSGTVGVGVNYMLGKHFSLAVEPRLNYYLSSINTNSEVVYRPYRIGIFTGVYYEF